VWNDEFKYRGLLPLARRVSRAVRQGAHCDTYPQPGPGMQVRLLPYEVKEQNGGYGARATLQALELRRLRMLAASGHGRRNATARPVVYSQCSGMKTRRITGDHWRVTGLRLALSRLRCSYRFHAFRAPRWGNRPQRDPWTTPWTTQSRAS
jgi:hypothetical protein